MQIVLSLLLFVGLMAAGAAYADCTGPAGKAGDFGYASNYSVAVYCDGTDWVSMAGSTGGGGATDSRIGTITANKWCVANAGGTGFDCTTNTPTVNVSPSGLDTQVQYNDNGVFGASSGFTWDKTVSRLTGTLISSSAGNFSGVLGVGTNGVPVAPLEVNGSIKLGGSGSETCNSSHYGEIRRNPTTGALQTCALR